MQRYFLKNEQFNGQSVRILGDDAHHIGRVMRGKPGDEVLVCNEDGACFVATLNQIGDDVEATLSKELEAVTELPVDVTIAQGLPKGDKLELVLQKGTECGAAGFIPVAMERSVVKLEAKKVGKKLERWQKICKEASEQAHRQKIPTVSGPLTLKELLALDFEVKLFAYEESAKQGERSNLKACLSQIKPGTSVLVLVGPEGGVSSKEAEALEAAGFFPCALGPRILRTETAPIYILSAISYALEL